MRDNPISTRAINRKRRGIWLVIIVVMILLYLPINRLTQGGVTLETGSDRSIPLIPPFIIPYLFGSIVFIGLPIWSALRAKAGEFESYAVSILAATIISYIIYLVLPTYVNRPEISAQDVFSRAIAMLYQADKIYNAAPSGHTFYSVLSAIYLSRWKPGLAWVWISGALLVLASTLLTRQHNILDLVAGLGLALGVYYIVRYIRSKWTANFAS
jgi:membrane-associated phospholipid phosphatase